MNSLAQFFAMEQFLKEKKMKALSMSKWIDRNTGQVLGQKVEVVIIEDNTPYAPAKDGTVKTNLYEKMTVKIKKEVSIPVGSIVELVGAKGRVYGDYQNNLSVTAEDIRVVSQTGGKVV